MTKVYASVYGCPTNIADYEISLGILKDAGFEIVNSPNESDINIIFTCIVKTPTEQRMVKKIQELTGLRKPLVVAGCMTKTSQRLIEKMSPKASLLGPDSINHIMQVIDVALHGKKAIFVKDERIPKTGRRVRKKSTVGIVPISTGCLSNCAYCSVKFARGRLKSYSIKKIVEEVLSLVNDGCREIWITSQDNGCYGVDIGTDLTELLNQVCAVEGDFRIRVGMMNPTYLKGSMLDDLVEIYKNKKIMKFLHIPVQSGSDKVLKDMKRGYTVSEFESIVERFRKDIPGLVLSTDIIVGFPGETERDFNKTVELLEKIKPEKVNVSKFGPRPGTDAANMEQLPVKILNERSRKIHNLISSF
jgi:threonylcarbamoyladenosine tRNA methylthiotransferase CDKAL1